MAPCVKLSWGCIAKMEHTFNKITEYQIGEYANYMGVTPDLLKHYEKLNLITSRKSSSGYRYYPFNESPRLLECMRLHNYGFTLKEIAEIFHTDGTMQVYDMQEEKIEELKLKIKKGQAIVEEHSRLKELKEKLGQKTEEWFIEESACTYFLPHSNRYDFIKDARIYEILKAWLSWMPLVKSALKMDKDAPPSWGLVIAAEKAQEYGLPLNDIVELLPAKKTFYYHFTSAHPTRGESIQMTTQRVLDQMQKLGFRPSGPYIRVIHMDMHWSDSLTNQWGYYAIPIAEDTK